MARVGAVVSVFIGAAMCLSGCGGAQQKPNLVISQATLSPSKFKEGDRVTLTFVVKNTGNAKAAPRPALSVSGDEMISRHVAPGAPGTSLAPGGEYSRKYSWDANNCGTQIKVHIDPGDRIDESNEVDNVWVQILDQKVCQEDPSKTAFYTDCVDRINKLRKLEGLPGLMRDSGKQACSNDDARVNFQSNDPHAQECGQAQNTCPEFSSTSKVLNDCIEQQMYYQEKQNYAANPSGCYKAPWPNTCGHYVNMTDKGNAGYTKVACGVYRTPSGGFFAVMNFFK